MNWFISVLRWLLRRPFPDGGNRDRSGASTAGTDDGSPDHRSFGRNDLTDSAPGSDAIEPSSKASDDVSLEEWMRAFDLDKEKAQLGQEKDRLAQENVRLWNELIERNARLDQITKAQTQAEQALHETIEREVDIVEALLPNIELLRDSRDVLRDRLKSRRSALTVLRDLSVRGGIIKGTRVEAAGGWLERHFNTGDRPNGRIYYRYSDERCSVLISFKADQPADIRYLQTL